MTLNRTSATAISSKPDLRTTGKKLRLPVILLALVATCPFTNLSTPRAADAASLPAAATERPVFASQRVRGLSPEVFEMALDAVASARARGISGRDDLLTIIDYSLPSTQPRLWVLDLKHGKVLFHELVAHGAGSGDNYATHFSNTKDSRQTSLGLFRTSDTYEGGNGYSLRLEGLDKGFNDLAEERHIVMHGAWYVSPEQIRSHGRLGRSWGCPAVSQQTAQPLIDTIKGGTFVFSYSTADRTWLRAATAALQQTVATLTGTTSAGR